MALRSNTASAHNVREHTRSSSYLISKSFLNVAMQLILVAVATWDNVTDINLLCAFNYNQVSFIIAHNYELKWGLPDLYHAKAPPKMPIYV